MKCSKCGSTEDLVVVGWMLGEKLKCTKCSEKPTNYVASEMSTGTEEWNQKAREVNGRLMAKYAK